MSASGLVSHFFLALDDHACVSHNNAQRHPTNLHKPIRHIIMGIIMGSGSNQIRARQTISTTTSNSHTNDSPWPNASAHECDKHHYASVRKTTFETFSPRAHKEHQGESFGRR
jgi:hypothetical protein